MVPTRPLGPSRTPPGHARLPLVASGSKSCLSHFSCKVPAQRASRHATSASVASIAMTKPRSTSEPYRILSAKTKKVCLPCKGYGLGGSNCYDSPINDNCQTRSDGFDVVAINRFFFFAEETLGWDDGLSLSAPMEGHLGQPS